MSLKDLVKATKQELPITVRHDTWMANNPNAHYSKEAVEFAQRVLSGELGGQRARKYGIRASGMSQCERQRVFKYFQTPERDLLDSRISNIFHTGNFMHLKWQMAGITEGWLTEAEVALDNDELELGGTADGFLYDGSLFEFKSINSRGYGWILRSGPKSEHVMQVHAYKLLRENLTAASIVYENKDNGEWREFRVQFEDEILTQVRAEVSGLKAYIQTQSLPAIRADCQHQEGPVYRACPFRDTCLATRAWPWHA